MLRDHVASAQEHKHAMSPRSTNASNPPPTSSALVWLIPSLTAGLLAAAASVFSKAGLVAEKELLRAWNRLGGVAGLVGGLVEKV